MVVGILMEKPSAARNGAKALGGSSGTYRGEQFVIAHARGHLYEYVKPARMVDSSLTDKYATWNLENLPWDPDDLTWQLEPIGDTMTVRGELKRTLAGCDEIAIACDDDPTGEGDAIAIRAIVELGLDTPGRAFSRMYFTDEAPASLQKAFTGRTPVPSLADHPAFAKAEYRSRWDYLSMQWTRIATAMARESGVDAFLRQGRLKSAMVRLVGDQLKAYEDYVKKPFFQNRFRDEHGVVYTNPDEPRFEMADRVPQDYTVSPVVLDAKTDKYAAPPKLLDLATLSSLLVARKITAKTVLATYQKMYEDRVVSYPRTEDKTITHEQFAELLPLVNKIAEVVGVDAGLLTHTRPRRTHVKDTGAHGANRPGPSVPASLDALATRYGPAAPAIYETLAKNYLAMLAEDYEYEQQKGHVEKYPDFTGTANVPKAMGWKQVFDATAEADEDENASGLGERAEPFVFEGANKRPEHPSMKWLMKQLEKRDVGTGATRTSTYAEVTNAAARYPLLVEKGRKLTLGEYGRMSWLLLPGTAIGDLSLTERVYADMRDIADGKTTAHECLDRVAGLVTRDVEAMRANAERMRAELGLSKKSVTFKSRATGVWSQTGTQVSFTKSFGGHEFTDDEVARLLAGEEIEFSATSKSGTSYDVFGKLAERTYHSRRFVGFEKLGFGKRDANGQVLPPATWCGHTFTPAEIEALKRGEAVEADDFVSKKGNRFQTKVTFEEPAPSAGTKIVPHFDQGTSTPPAAWCGHTFSAEEKNKLASGESIHVEGLRSKKGKTFSADLAWKDEGGRRKIVPAFG